MTYSLKSVQFAALLVSFFAITLTASAHAVVSPAEAPVSTYQTFTLGVPNEKDIPTTAVRLIVPEQVGTFTPFVKPGWKIDIKKEGERVVEVTWSGGTIPADQKDAFQFTARTPDESATLSWKAYQTYADGSVVAWDQTPSGEHHDDSVPYPYSQTQIGDGHGMGHHKGHTGGLPLAASALALVLSGAALWTATKKTV